MKHIRPSQVQKKLVMETVSATVYANKGQEYKEEFNPYKKESTNHGRFERQYPKAREKYLWYETLLNDMIQFYGPLERKT